MVQRRNILFIVLAAFCLTAFNSLPQKQVEVKKSQASSADVYLVDITALNISSIDLSAGTYAVDFYISFTCKTPPCKYEPTWDVMNATGDISPEDQGTSIPFKVYDYRLKTTLIGKVDYQFYPFDYLYIEMFIEDKEHNSQELTYELNSIEVDNQLFNPSGWYYKPEYNGGETNSVSYFGDTATTFDRLDVWMFLERDRFGAFMKTIFAAIVIVLIGMLSFLMRPDSVSERLALTSSTLVAIVLYHISLVAGVPATGYLTFIDKFMIGTYVVVFFSLGVSVLLMVYVNRGHLDKAEKIHLLTRWTVPAAWVVLMICVFIFELFIPYQQLLIAGGGA